ncbi:MAG TPA: tRNA-dihydrouridine synthase [Nitrospira sp.]|nr:tRNA-dihydrouridine synthase [Nitrospira sp.]
MTFWNVLPKPVIGLSPMDGVTDAAFRLMTARHGKPDVMFTEFTHVHDICRGPEFLLESLQYDEAERPIVAQLYGKDPTLFYQAAHVVCELGFDGLDINMGCPSRNVASSGSGAGLIRTPDLAHAIMRAARQGIMDWTAGQTLEGAGLKTARADAIRRLHAGRDRPTAAVRSTIPLSVKTRLGYDEVIVERWVEHLLLESPAVISLHGRTLQQMYKGEADWAAIGRAARVVEGSGTLLFGNGDVQSLGEVATRVRETGVDGVLVGRAALGAPWFFRDKEQARHLAQSAEPRECQPWTPSIDDRFEMLLAHAREFDARGGSQQFRRMRKHLGWYCKGFPHAAALRARMFLVSSLAEVEAVLVDHRQGRLIDGDRIDQSSLSELETADLISRCG